MVILKCDICGKEQKSIQDLHKINTYTNSAKYNDACYSCHSKIVEIYQKYVNEYTNTLKRKISNDIEKLIENNRI